MPGFYGVVAMTEQSVNMVIKALVKEGDLYRAQGLLSQSKQKYLQILELIQKSESLSQQQKLLSAIKKRIADVSQELIEVEQERDLPILSPEIQTLVKNVFSFSANKQTAEMEGATALAKFGQYERALAEFRRLLDDSALAVTAAKNIVRCYVGLGTPEAAVEEYTNWVRTGSQLTDEMLNEVRLFLEDRLKRKGIDATLPTRAAQESSSGGEDEEQICMQDAILDITSIGIRLPAGAEQGKVIDMEVSFQSGAMVSVTIPNGKKDYLEAMKIGSKFSELLFYSSIAIFRGKGVVSDVTQIKLGPMRGGFVVDILVSIV